MTIYKYQQNLNKTNPLTLSEANLNLLDKVKIHKKNVNIKKIQFNNTNKLIINYLIKNKSILEWKELKKVNNLNKVKKLLNAIQQSGFFYSIKTLKFTNSGKYSESFILKIKLNPILKKICILKYNKLEIPIHFLKHIFESQIGLPKNYHKINKSIKKIQKWYKSKGFKFINIRLINQDIKNDISIEINEGIIEKIEIFCKTKNLFNTELINNLNQLIKQELNIRSGHALNIKNLESTLLSLKQLNLLKDFNYIIYYSNKFIYLKIYYNILEKPSLYLYFKNQFIKKQKSLFKALSKKRTLLEFINKPVAIIQTLKSSSYLKKLQQNLKFHYYHRNRSQYMDYLTVSMKLTNQFQNTDIYIFKHILSIKNQAKIIGTFIISRDSQFSYSKLLYPFIYINKNINKYIQITSSRSKIKNIKILFKHSLIQYINVIETLSISTYFHHEKYLNLNNLIFRNKFRINNHIYKTIHKLKKNSKIIKYRLVYIEITIRYNSLYLIQSLPIGQLISIDSKLFTMIIPNLNSSVNKLEYLGQMINGKYLHNFYLPNLLPSIYKNIVTCFFEANYMLNKSLLLPIYINNYYKNHLSYYSLTTNIPQYSYCLLKIELHIYKWKYTSLYFFSNLINNSYARKNYENIRIQPSFKFNTQNQGLGIQLNIPIKRLSNIKIKYIQNNRKESSIQISNHLKYN